MELWRDQAEGQRTKARLSFYGRGTSVAGSRGGKKQHGSLSTSKTTMAAVQSVNLNQTRTSQSKYTLVCSGLRDFCLAHAFMRVFMHVHCTFGIHSLVHICVFWCMPRVHLWLTPLWAMPLVKYKGSCQLRGDGRSAGNVPWRPLWKLVLLCFIFSFFFSSCCFILKSSTEN